MAVRDAQEAKAVPPGTLSGTLSDAPGGPPNTDGGWIPIIMVGQLLTLGVALFWLPLRDVRLGAMNGYGLISVLPITTLLGAAVLILTFMITLGMSRPHRVLLTLQLAIILFSLHNLAQSLEPYARFETAWQHAGFIEFITRTHTVDGSLDARYNWAGFFAAVGFVMEAVGQHDIEPVLRWAPLVMNAMYLVPFVLILRIMRATWRAKWLAAFLLIVGNWVGQDYLAPQAFGYLLYLYFVAIMINWFRGHDERPRREGRRRSAQTRERTGPLWRVYGWIFGPKDPGELPARDVSLRDRSILFLLLVMIFTVATASHQLTPFLMLAACGGLVLLRRCTLRGLPVLGGVIFAAWVSYLTVGYWGGHTTDLFSGLGSVGSNVGSSVGGRINESSPQLAHVQTLRIVIAVLVFGLACAGLLRRRIRGMDDRVALILLLVPFTSFGLQNYGGEIALRIYFFLLPGACLLMAYLFFPAPFDAPAVPVPTARLRFAHLRAGSRRHWPAVAAAAVFGLVITGGFLVVRYGNEKFEQVRPGEVKAYDTILNQDKDKNGVTIVWPTADDPRASATPLAPWGFRSMERFGYAPVPVTKDPADLRAILQRLRQAGPGGFFVTTRGQETYAELNNGLPADFAPRMRKAAAASVASGELRQVYVDRDAAVYALRNPPPEPVVKPPPAAGIRFGSTPWTVAGVIYLPVLLGVLITRELRRLRLTPAEYRKLRPLTVLSFPLFVAVMAVIVERFVTLGG